jgi:hypothetical protein
MYFISCLCIVDQNDWVVLISTEVNDQFEIVKANRDEFRAACNQPEKTALLSEMSANVRLMATK